ncbi:hypothetical protein [Agreia bicolorata]|uniref:Uncharacterized protein n=1 Tax=Agreia bicolorata TaxID=110935 RepID=A0ABR5CHM5_9MICO|nr:hypothetical protein [Agreia bicolorata]KJC65002.1 hypothetical protein TZ00_05235 [Agreia bicolorata]
MAGRYDRDEWTDTDRPSSSLPALGSAGAFFIAANVNAAVWTSGNLSFWGFVIIGAIAGATGVFVSVFLVCKAVFHAVRRLPVSMPMRTRQCIGGALVGVVTLIAWTATLGFFQVLAIWLYLLPSMLAAAITAGLVAVVAMRAAAEEPRRPRRANI